MRSYLPLIITLSGSVIVGSFLIYWYKMKLAKYIYKKYDKIVWNNNQNHVSLTIDDAPYTKESFQNILNILNKYNIKATFFIISSYVNNDNWQLLIDAVKNGHHLANHGKNKFCSCIINKR